MTDFKKEMWNLRHAEGFVEKMVEIFGTELMMDACDKTGNSSTYDGFQNLKTQLTKEASVKLITLLESFNKET